MKNCPTCQTSYPNNFMVCPQDGVPLVDIGAWSEGAVIRGKYRIVCKVGQGGMGTVYKVVHVAFEEVHALKVILPALMSDDLFVKRFKHEAVITRKLQHPNAVRVDDIDEAEDGRPIIVMEYIEGQSLKHLIQEQGALPVPRVCSIIKQAAAALAAAHDLGMVHRDIKPDNIVLVETTEGEMVKVLDFGIAKIKEARNSDAAGMTLTGTGVVIGTPQYMSPEQAMGKRGDELNGRSDLYSLGVVMYQMLTGDLPFKADTTMGMLLAHMQTDPTPIRRIHPELQIPEPIANVVMRTLQKNPDDRPQTALALIEEIEAAENWSPPLGETRVMGHALDYSPQDSARRLRESLETPAPPKIPPRRPASPSGYVSRPVPVPSPPPPQPVPEPRPAPVLERPVPQPRPVVVPSPAPRPKSSAGLWAVVGILAILLVTGGGYLFLKSSNTGNVTPPQDQTPITDKVKGEKSGAGTSETEQKNSQPDQSGTPGGTTTEKQADDHPADANQGGGKKTGGLPEFLDPNKNKRERTPAKRETGGSGGERIVPTRPTADPAKVAGSIKLGDFYLSRGEYDNAITEFQKGLSLDPSNATLREKLDRAKKAKAAESRVLN
ncbi:MAG TPA: protein kinase [Terriglobia bacterium]|nr:protein kinase [Terriglobia bacterium]